MIAKIGKGVLVVLMVVGTVSGLILVYLLAQVPGLVRDAIGQPQSQGFSYAPNSNSACTPKALEPNTSLVSYAEMPQGIKGTSWADHEMNIFFDPGSLTVLDIATGNSWTFNEDDFNQPCEWHAQQGIMKLTQGSDVYWFIPIGNQVVAVKESGGQFEVQRTVYSEETGLKAYQMQQFTPNQLPDPSLNQQA